MHKINPAIAPIGIAAVAALTLGQALTALDWPPSNNGLFANAAHAQSTQPVAQWAASATGRVEPGAGEVRIGTAVPARIIEVLSSTNDVVKRGDLLVRLDDEDIALKIAAARAEVSVREREREEEEALELAAERREAEDALAKAERELYDAREDFDKAYRSVKGGDGSETDVETARTRVETAAAAIDARRAELMTVNAKDGMPQSQRLEASLAAARAELMAYEVALERTRIRAPSDGTVLNMIARVGEFAAPSPDSPLVVLGDISSLRLRAEVEERDAAKVHVGQAVVVKSDAYPDATFTGKVSSISQSLTSPRLATRGPRRPNDVEVVEVMVALDGKPPLLTGMRVDVFFEINKSKDSASVGSD
jgi:HlyD family secretion protein